MPLRGSAASALSEVAESACSRLLHRIEISVPAVVRIDRQQRRLGKKTWMFASMRLRRMHDERMTEVHRAGLARGGDDGPVCACGEIVSSELPHRQPLFSCGRELQCDIKM